MPKEFLIRGSESSEDKHLVTIRGILLLEHVSLFVSQNQTISPMDVIGRGQSTTIIDMVTPNQLTNQPDDYRVRLPLTSEKAILNLNYFFTVVCPIRHPVIWNEMVEL